jgi:hypothetical protein
MVRENSFQESLHRRQGNCGTPAPNRRTRFCEIRELVVPSGKNSQATVVARPVIVTKVWQNGDKASTRTKGYFKANEA